MKRQLLFGAISPDSTFAWLAVTVCGTTSLLVQTTVSPAATSRRSGENFIPSMVTLCVFPAASAAAGRSARQTAMSAARIMLLLREVALDHLRVLEVSRDGRTDLDDQVLQLGV